MYIQTDSEGITCTPAIL